MTPLLIPEEDKQFIESKELDFNTIAKYFKVQDAYLMEYEKATFRNAETSNLLFQKLLPKVECIYFKRLSRKEKKRKRKTGFLFTNGYIGLKQ